MSASGAAPEGQAHLPDGTVVASRYRIEGVVGEGAQSVVYLARTEPEGDRVALKVIHRHLSGAPHVQKRFRREAKILGNLEGEHIVKLLDLVEQDGLFILALEHVEGTSLEAMLTDHAPLALDVAIEIALQVCAALGVAHAHGVIHRDLKPANVLVERPREALALGPRGIRVKVVDFGLGKVLRGELMSTGLTEQGMIFGTPEYMAPEQARGDELDARADLYAAGVMLYEMAVGDVPFQGRSALSTMTAHLREAPPSPRKARPEAPISPTLEAVILRALSKSPADRYATARELAEAISAARDEPLVITPPSAPQTPDIATSDTDLHLERAEMGQATTLRADEVAALAASERANSAVLPRRPSDMPPTRPSPRTPAAAEPAPRKRAPVVIDDEPTAVSGAPPPRTTLLWAVVAVVAALVGVAIGVIVGTR